MIVAKLFLHRKLNEQGRKESGAKERGVIGTVAGTDTKEYASLFCHIAHFFVFLTRIPVIKASTLVL
jgi:hypothetical protein